MNLIKLAHRHLKITSFSEHSDLQQHSINNESRERVQKSTVITVQFVDELHVCTSHDQPLNRLNDRLEAMYRTMYPFGHFNLTRT